MNNNVVYAVVSLVFQVAFSLVLAGVLEEFVRPRLRRTVLRSIYFIPSVISITVAGLLFAFIYNPRFGLLNRLLGVVGLDTWQALLARRAGDRDLEHHRDVPVAERRLHDRPVRAWPSSGYRREMYEAARVDGAGRDPVVLHHHRPDGARDDDAPRSSSPSQVPSWCSTR